MKPNKLPVYELLIDDENQDEIFAISIVSDPAIELGFQYFNREKVQFAEINKDKRLIMGPILVPNKRILRIDGEGKQYEVFFKPETVRRLAEMYLEKKYTDQTTVEHERKIKGVNLVESWIVDNKFQDKSKAYGFNVPEGSWMGVFRVDKSDVGEKVWQEIKSGKSLSGFSIEGLFSHNLVAASKVDDILEKDIKELTEAEATIVLSKIVEVFEQPSITSTYPGEAAVGKKEKYVSPALLVDEESVCPPATQDVQLNLENRQKAIDEAMYGPLDIKNPGDYWETIAEKWDVPVEEAKGEICGNCAAFNLTKKVLNCIAEGIGGEDAWDVVEAGDLGYCEIYKFKCNANRSCFAHIDGGAITD